MLNKCGISENVPTALAVPEMSHHFVSDYGVVVASEQYLWSDWGCFR